MAVITVRVIVSIHAPVQAGDEAQPNASDEPETVSIHAPVQAGDKERSKEMIREPSFNPRPRTSGRLTDSCPTFTCISMFQSTPPYKRATVNLTEQLGVVLFQSTPPYKRATVAECDAVQVFQFQSTPPYKRATAPPLTRPAPLDRFQSTPPYKRATHHIQPVKWLMDSFNPRPRTSGRPRRRPPPKSESRFQSTPPYKRATKSTVSPCKLNMFQSTPPYKRATHLLSLPLGNEAVSIHAPVQAGDAVLRKSIPLRSLFQSTPPYKRATELKPAMH